MRTCRLYKSSLAELLRPDVIMDQLDSKRANGFLIPSPHCWASVLHQMRTEVVTATPHALVHIPQTHAPDSLTQLLHLHILEQLYWL
jgi:hypothetical protein